LPSDQVDPSTFKTQYILNMLYINLYLPTWQDTCNTKINKTVVHSAQRKTNTILENQSQKQQID